jgi:hypothetical protein
VNADSREVLLDSVVSVDVVLDLSSSVDDGVERFVGSKGLNERLGLLKSLLKRGLLQEKKSK